MTLLTSLEQAGKGSRLLLVDLNAAPFTREFFDALNGYATGGSGRCLETLAIWNAHPAPPPPSVSIDNGPRPQEAVPTCDAKPAVVAHSTYLSAVAGRMAFRDAYRRCLPVVQAAEALAAKWTREGQKVDSDDFYAAINDVWEAVAKRNGDPLAKDDGAYAATPQPADGCSSNEGAGK